LMYFTSVYFQLNGVKNLSTQEGASPRAHITLATNFKPLPHFSG